jgi:aryl-alcohol dehydrogenase-like predicted oxidoreductase
MACLPYFSLAKGFLTGKYRPGVSVESERSAAASAYLDDRGGRVLSALDAVASARSAPVAAVALAWLAAQPTVAAVVASARTPAQLSELLPVATLELARGEIDALTLASSGDPG